MVYCLRISIAFLALALFGPGASAQSQQERKELPNFHKINDRLYRSAQPKADGYKRLAELGIKTVIDLRGAGRRARAEEAQAQAAGLRYFNVPLPAWGRPDDRQIERVLALIDAPENWPVLIHCRRGADRTGLIVACYRISREGWALERARDEARQCGLSWAQWWMKDYISDYYHQRQQWRQAFTQADSGGPRFAEHGLDEKIGRGISAIEYALGKSAFGVRWFFR